jgi:hypothetical protein
MNKLLNLSLVGLLLTSPVSAIAATQTITGSQAQGESGSIPTIKLALNIGLPIKMPQGWRIYKGWLDNSTLAEVDGDRPFEQGATILYLVGRKAGAGKLSMVVRDPSGMDRLFVLKIATGAKSSPDIIFVKDNRAGIMSAKTGGRTPVDAIRQGMEVAVGQGRLIRGSDLWKSIESFNSLVGQGVSSDAASSQTGVNLGVIKQLLDLAKDSPSTPSTIPVPVEPIPKAPAFDGGVVNLPSPPEAEKVAVEPPKPAEKPADIPEPDFEKTFVVSQKEPDPPKPKKVKHRKVKLAPVPQPNITIPEPLVLSEVPEPIPTKTADFYQKKSEPVSNHEIANGLVRGLLSPKNHIAKRGSYGYQKLQDVVWFLRKGKSLKVACTNANVALETATTILAYGGVEFSITQR